MLQLNPGYKVALMDLRLGKYTGPLDTQFTSNANKVSGAMSTVGSCWWGKARMARAVVGFRL